MHPGNSFYKLDDAIKYGDQAKPIFRDYMGGNYESIGALPGSTPEKRLIRIAMGNQGGTFKDYSIEKKKRFFGSEDYTITPLQRAPIKVCQNLPSVGLDRQLPVLSRDGQMIAGREYGTQKTQIFRINSATGDCTALNKIPMVTSKVSFMFDNQHVIYVVKDPVTKQGRLLKKNIASGEAITISGPMEDVDYMTAKTDGTIFYSRSAKKGFGQNSDLVELDRQSTEPVSDEKPYQALGMMWGASCGKELDLDYAAAMGRRMTGQSCNEVISQQKVSTLAAEYQGITDGQLKTICDSRTASVSKPATGTN